MTSTDSQQEPNFIHFLGLGILLKVDAGDLNQPPYGRETYWWTSLCVVLCCVCECPTCPRHLRGSQTPPDRSSSRSPCSPSSASCQASHTSSWPGTGAAISVPRHRLHTHIEIDVIDTHRHTHIEIYMIDTHT